MCNELELAGLVIVTAEQKKKKKRTVNGMAWIEKTHLMVEIESWKKYIYAFA